jgi:hypothetical protein
MAVHHLLLHHSILLLLLLFLPLKLSVPDLFITPDMAGGGRYSIRHSVAKFRNCSLDSLQK